KNRAENLMITDMVRNDLGKIAETGSVDVSGLFAVEAYPTVWQMTSTVHAKTQASLVDIFRTLFPAASITGAPKRAAMGQIAQLEKTPRGIYTGAIGYIAPNRQAQFSIAIRTSTVDKVAGSAQYGAGGGIVWDSTPVQEYVEMQAKTRILGTLQEQENIELFETLRWTPGEGFSRLHRHLRRMAKSAAVFGYPVDEQRAEAALQQAVNGSAAQALRVRLSLTVEGDYRVDLAELPSDIQSRNSQPICLATTPVCSTDLYLIHKTSHRQVYDRATTEVPAGAEPILFNEQGEITESSIANVVYTLGDDWFTPPVESGLLPGILREELLEQGKVKVRKLALDELDEVTEIQLINDLRGWRRAHWK
ncbi:MAG: chorismate-binding protein, partial [Pseudomonadales bacterium]